MHSGLATIFPRWRGVMAIEHSADTQPELGERTLPHEKLINPSEAAAFLGVSTKTLANGRVSGKSPPYFKIYGRIRYRPTDLVDYVGAHRRLSTSDVGSNE